MKNLPDDGYLLEQLLHGSVDIIYFKDIESRFVLYNPACAAKHGWKTLEEGIGKSDFDVFAEEHARQARADEVYIMETGQILRGIEEREIWPDGRVTWVSSSKIPIRDDGGTIVGIFGISRDITAQMEAKLKAQHYAEQIRIIKEEMEEDAQMADRLQKGFSFSDYPLFPDGVDAGSGCIEFLHHLNKRNVVSGDFFSIRRLSDHTVSLLICDILSAGARAALGAALIHGIMQEIEPLANDPSAYLERMNELLHPRLHPDPDHLLLGVTACYLVLDVSTGKTRMASAGHPLPLHFRRGYPVKWFFENLVLRGPALAQASHSRYHTIECSLQADDSVVLFTDGLFKLKNIQKEPFSEKRLLGAAQTLAGQSLDGILRGLENAALAFSMEKDFSHDVLLLGFHLRKLMELS